MKRRDFLKRAGIGVAASAAFGPVFAQGSPTVRWRMASSFPKSLDTIYGAAEVLADRVSALTGGRFQIRVYQAGEIVPGLQVMDAVQQGTVEAGHTASYYYVGKAQVLAFDTSVPFGLTARQQNAWMYHGGGIELFRPIFADFNIIQFPGGNTGVQMGGWFRKEVRSLADLKGLKGRFVGLASAVMADFGVAVSPLPTSEVYSALDKGLIDVADRGDIKANYEEGIHEVAKYLILPGVHQPTTATSYIANTGAYEALDNQQKAALAVAAREVSGALRQDILVSNGEYLRKFADAGVEIIDFDPADVVQGRERAVESWAKAATDDLSKRMMESQMALMQELRLL